MAQRKSKFNAEGNFTCNRQLLTIDGVAYTTGDPIDTSKITRRSLRNMFNTRKIRLVIDEGEATIAEVPAPIATKTTTPEIVGPQKGGWFKVMLGDEQIGDSTRDRDEAELIVMEWEDGHNNEGEA